VEWKLHNVENYNEACTWMEKESDEIEKIASGASNPNDLKRSQQLAVILLFTRQY
jgi:hypothetical protein